MQAAKRWVSRCVRRTLRRLGVAGDAEVDSAEMGEVASAVNPYLFLARHGMAVAGTTGRAGKSRPAPATTADSNGASTANVAPAVADTHETKPTKSLLE